MKGAQVRAHDGAREADVTPARAAAETTWWTPADPAGLGLAGFALTTFILGMVNANAISGRDVFVVLSVSACCAVATSRSPTGAVM